MNEIEVWFRLGGFVKMLPAEISRFREGNDELKAAALKHAIIRNGFEISGDTYAVDEENGLNCDVSVELAPMELVPKYQPESSGKLSVADIKRLLAIKDGKLVNEPVDCILGEHAIVKAKHVLDTIELLEQAMALFA